MSAPRRKLGPAPSVETGCAAEAIRALAAALLPQLREFIATDRLAHELVDIATYVPGSKRVIMRAAREGRIANAARIGRRWIAPRASIEDWLRAQGPRVVERTNSNNDDLDGLRIRLARQGRR